MATRHRAQPRQPPAVDSPPTTTGPHQPAPPAEPTPRRRNGYFFYLRNLPRWGLEARRRLRAGEMAKGDPKPTATAEEAHSEGLIWIAANHPLPYWALTISYPLPLLLSIAYAVFLISR